MAILVQKMVLFSYQSSKFSDEICLSTSSYLSSVAIYGGPVHHPLLQG